MEKILDQMNNSFYQIINNRRTEGNAFFCHIKHKNKWIPVLISNSHSFNNMNIKTINVSKNNILKTFEVGDTIYINLEYDLSIIQIKDNFNEEINFLEMDDKLYEEEPEPEIYYNNQSIYILNNKNENKNDISVSFGIIKNLNNSEIRYYSNKNSKAFINRCNIISGMGRKHAF